MGIYCTFQVLRTFLVKITLIFCGFHIFKSINNVLFKALLSNGVKGRRASRWTVGSDNCYPWTSTVQKSRGLITFEVRARSVLKITMFWGCLFRSHINISTYFFFVFERNNTFFLNQKYDPYIYYLLWL